MASNLGTNQGYSARLEGIIYGECTNTSTEFNFVVPYDRAMDGIQYKVEGSSIGDNVTFQVVHPTLGVVHEFAKNWYVSDSLTQMILYKANLPTGLTVRVTYNKTGAGTPKIFINLFLHEAKI